jgi:hypothetical protein
LKNQTEVANNQKLISDFQTQRLAIDANILEVHLQLANVANIADEQQRSAVINSLSQRQHSLETQRIFF